VPRVLCSSLQHRAVCQRNGRAWKGRLYSMLRHVAFLLRPRRATSFRSRVAEGTRWVHPHANRAEFTLKQHEIRRIVNPWILVRFHRLNWKLGEIIAENRYFGRGVLAPSADSRVCRSGVRWPPLCLRNASGRSASARVDGPWPARCPRRGVTGLLECSFDLR
jgi:hypothetical protein